jgi:hypothetical protein
MQRSWLAVALVLGACGSHDATAPAPGPVARTAPPDALNVAAAPSDAQMPRADVAVAAALMAPGDTPPSVGMVRRPPGLDLRTEMDEVEANEKGPGNQVKISRVEDLDGTDPNGNLADQVVKGGFAGLKRCYADHQTIDATAHGEVTIALTVGKTGTVADATTTGFDNHLAACVQTRVREWRFAPLNDKQGHATPGRFRITLELTKS